jgi:hypothetical protein
MDEATKTPTPKLHLRDLFWLVLVVGLGVGWWRDRQQVRDSCLESVRSLAESHRQERAKLLGRIKALESGPNVTLK